MSHRRVVSLLALFAGVVAAGAGLAQPGGADPTILLDEVRRIAAQVERLREEPFSDPPRAVRAPDSMRQVAAEIRAYNVLSRGRLAARGRAWAELGLGNTESPRRLMLLLAADLDGIGFDPQGNRLLVSPERLHPNDFEPSSELTDPATLLLMTGVRPDEPLVAHFLLHVRQRERSGRDPLRPTTDQLLASLAWAEGEANLAALRFLFEGMDLADAILGSNLHPGQVLDGSLLPPGLDELAGIERGFIHFVYLEGFDRAAEIYRAGGWEALADAMQRRTTTRDLLHPEAASTPVPTFPVRDTLDGLPLADEDSLGEQAIVVLVSTLTGKDSLGLVAGEGWTGDRLYRWESADGAEGVTEWDTRWVGPEAAADFAYACGRTLTARFPGRELRDEGAGRRSLAAGGRVFRLTRRGDVVRLRVADPARDARLEQAEARQAD